MNVLLILMNAICSFYTYKNKRELLAVVSESELFTLKLEEVIHNPVKGGFKEKQVRRMAITLGNAITKQKESNC